MHVYDQICNWKQFCDQIETKFSIFSVSSTTYCKPFWSLQRTDDRNPLHRAPTTQSKLTETCRGIIHVDKSNPNRAIEDKRRFTCYKINVAVWIDLPSCSYFSSLTLETTYPLFLPRTINIVDRRREWDSPFGPHFCLMVESVDDYGSKWNYIVWKKSRSPCPSNRRATCSKTTEYLMY